MTNTEQVEHRPTPETIEQSMLRKMTGKPVEERVAFLKERKRLLSTADTCWPTGAGGKDLSRRLRVINKELERLTE